jgi:hypothetical protein
MKLSLLTNATVVDNAIRFVPGKSNPKIGIQEEENERQESG